MDIRHEKSQAMRREQNKNEKEMANIKATKSEFFFLFVPI